jgi:hypothetical protein
MSAALRVSSSSSASALGVQAGEAKLSMSLPRNMQYEEYMQTVLASMAGDAIASWVAALGTSPEDKAKAVLDFCAQASKFQAKQAQKTKNNMSEVSDDSAKIATARRLEAGRALQALVAKATSA